MNNWCPVCGRKRQINHTYCIECEEEMMDLETALKQEMRPGESFPDFALRVYKLRVTLNTFSKIPIGVKVNCKEGIARFYFKKKKE